MTTGVAEVVAIGDLRQVALAIYRDQILAICVMPSGDIVLHREGDGTAEYDRLGLRGAKDKVSGDVIGEMLHLTWSAGRQLFYCRWDMGQRMIVVPPHVLAAGSAPAMQKYQATKLVIGYVDLFSRHMYVTSSDGGGTWTVPESTHADSVSEVDWYVTSTKPYEADLAEVRAPPPTIEAVVIGEQLAGTSGDYQIVAALGGGPGPLTYRVDAPEWFTVNRDTGLLSWTIPEGTTGPEDITIAVFDGVTHARADIVFTWIFVPVAPVIDAFTLPLANAGALLEYQVTWVNGNSGQPHVASLSGAGLPGWVTITSAGLLAVAPPADTEGAITGLTVSVFDGVSTDSFVFDVIWSIGVAGAAGGDEASFSVDGAPYKAHVFNASASLTVDGDLNVEYLLVAGGGGGGGYTGGGGGAGGLRQGVVALSAGSYPVTVGGGGAGGTTSQGTDGQESSFSGLSAVGGGGGGVNGGSGRAGGSGGGAGHAAGVGGAGTAGQGFAGGSGANAPNYPGGGGGGAGAVGANAPSNSAGGNGGEGLLSDISGTPTYYAGGGGGGTYLGGTRGLGGLGGGGDATGISSTAQGQANTGGGGGGSVDNGTTLAGVGGSGVVIIRYNTGPSITYVAAYELTNDAENTITPSLVGSPYTDFFVSAGVLPVGWTLNTANGNIVTPLGADPASVVGLVISASLSGVPVVSNVFDVALTDEPEDVVDASLRLLLDSETTALTLDGSAVSAWSNAGTAGGSFTSTGAARPVVRGDVVTGRDVVYFDGVDDFLEGLAASSYLTAAEYTIFIVVRAHSITSNNATVYQNEAIWADAGGYAGGHLSTNYGSSLYNWNGGVQQVSDLGVTTTNLHLIEQRHGGGFLNQRIDDTAPPAATASGNTDSLASLLRLGRAYSTFPYANISLCHFRVYNRELTTSEIAKVRAYLAWKWPVSA